MRSVRRGQSLIILWWAVGPFRKFPNPKGQIDIWILGIGFALMNSQGWLFAFSFGEQFAEKSGELQFGFGFAFGSRTTS